MVLKCAVVCEGSNGPFIAFVQVDCTEEQYENGDHYDAAKDWARDQDFDDPMVVIDERDSHAMSKLIQPTWKKILKIATPYGG